MKKLTALLLCLTLLLTFPSVAYAADADKDPSAAYINFETSGLALTRTPAEMVAAYPEAAQYILDELTDYGKYTNGEPIRVFSYNIPKDIASELFFAVVFENPEKLFYINPTSLSRSLTDTYAYAYYPEFLFGENEIEQKRAELESTVNLYMKGVDKIRDDVTKARYLHDLIITQVYYPDLSDVVTLDHAPAGLFLNGRAVCQGFSLAYKLLLDRCGISSTVVSSEEMNHSWNMVNIGGHYYHTDVTWDDVEPDSVGLVMHDYFLRSEAAFTANGQHYGWASGFTADDTTYDEMWWNDVNTAIYPIGNKDYYILKDGTNGVLTARDSETGGTESITAVNSKPWMVKTTSGYCWSKCYSFLALYCGWFYYNDSDSVYRIPAEGGEPEVMFTKDTDYDIYGFYIPLTGGKLYCTIKEKINTADNLVEAAIPSATEHFLAKRLAVSDGDENFPEFEITADEGGYRASELLGFQLSTNRENAVRFVNFASSDVLDSAKEYGFVFSPTTEETASAKANAAELTLENGTKEDCTGTTNEMTGGYGDSDFTSTDYKYVTASVYNLENDSAVVARFYIIDENDNVFYSSYIDSAGQSWSGCAARLSDAVQQNPTEPETATEA